MSYSTIEGYWLGKLQDMPQFDGSNSSRGKWGMLNSGKSAYYAILKPGAHTHTWITMGGMGSSGAAVWQHNYRTIIQLWQRYTADGDALIALEELDKAVSTYLARYRKLGDTSGVVQDGDIIESREVIQIPADAPAWLMVELVGECLYEETITFAE